MRPSRRPAPTEPGGLYRATAPVSPAGVAPRIAPADATTRGFERQRELDRECAEVGAAVLLASGGRVSSVVVCNLKHARVVVPALRGVAAELAVRLEPIARPDGTGTDSAVRSH